MASLALILFPLGCDTLTSNALMATGMAITMSLVLMNIFGSLPRKSFIEAERARHTAETGDGDGDDQHVGKDRPGTELARGHHHRFGHRRSAEEGESEAHHGALAAISS